MEWLAYIIIIIIIITILIAIIQIIITIVFCRSLPMYLVTLYNVIQSRTESGFYIARAWGKGYSNSAYLNYVKKNACSMFSREVANIVKL